MDGEDYLQDIDSTRHSSNPPILRRLCGIGPIASVLQLLTTEYAMEIFFPLLDKEIAPPYSEE
jgi:hypothetical protein